MLCLVVDNDGAGLVARGWRGGVCCGISATSPERLNGLGWMGLIHTQSS